jgi:hypothetical protein
MSTHLTSDPLDASSWRARQELREIDVKAHATRDLVRLIRGFASDMGLL